VRTILVSSLRHYVYCPRQCALVHLEQQWGENLFTLRGDQSHRRVDEGSGEWDAGVRVERSMPIWSERLGLTGKSDVVEFRPDGTVYPVEYKHGRRGPGLHFDVQLCAQALCLEEMLEVAITQGAIYHVKSRRRREVALDDALRERTEGAIRSVRALLSQASLPPPVADRGLCRACSLIDICMPDVPSVATDWLFDPAVDETP